MTPLSLMAGVLLAAASPDTLVVPLREITVTGSRIPQSQLRMPAASSVVPASEFARARKISLASALTDVPGVFVQSRAGASDVRITIRGFGARGNGDRSNAGNIRGIRILTDGIPVTEPDGRTSLDLVDLGNVDRIEVSRSNASVLYGNASGGVLNLRSRFSFKQPFVRFEQEAGSFGYHREQGTLGFVAGQGRGTITVSNTTFQGWRQHSESFTTRAQVRFAAPIAGRSRLLLMADGSSNLMRFPGALTAAQLNANREQANPVYVTRDERRFNRVGRLAATLEHEVSDRQEVSVSTWLEPKVLMRSERNRFRDFTRFNVGASGTWSMHWEPTRGVQATTSAGFDESYQDGAILFYNLAPGGTRSTTVFANKREGANSAGAFIQQALSWNERWTFQAAARYDNLGYVSDDFVVPKLKSTKRFTQVTPKASLTWAGSDKTVWAAVGGGVEAPAFNEIDPPAPYDTLTALNPFLEPMRSLTAEVGSRGALGSSFGAWSYDAAAYWIEVSNEVVPFNGGAYFFTAGKSRRQGLEASVTWKPVDRLTVKGGGTLSKNEYKEYRNDVGDFSGKAVPGLPAVSFSSSAALELRSGWRVEASLHGAGKYFADDANTAETIGFGVVGAKLGYERAATFGSLRAWVAGDNLLDKEYIGSVFINGISGIYFEPGLPANVSAGLSIGWR